jgi:hypothetical protein
MRKHIPEHQSFWRNITDEKINYVNKLLNREIEKEMLEIERKYKKEENK